MERQWSTEDLEITNLMANILNSHGQRGLLLLGLLLRISSALSAVILIARLPCLFFHRGHHFTFQGLFCLFCINESLSSCQEFLVCLGWPPIKVCIVWDVLPHTFQSSHKCYLISDSLRGNHLLHKPCYLVFQGLIQSLTDP